MISMSSHSLLALAAVLIMVCAHIFSPKLLFLDRTPRSIWLSVAGGVSVAYVFAHLLPEIAELQRSHFGEADIEAALYLMALIGFVTFYGLERLARSRARAERKTSAAGFWLHLGSFAGYNLLIGYLLHEQARIEGQGGLFLYAAAMTLHFVVNDRSLYRHHGGLYLSRGRWLLVLAALFGWLSGVAVEIDMTIIAGAMSFLAGSVVLNVIKEELPEDRESRYWAFALGAAAYAVILML